MSAAIVVAPARANADTMSTRCPAHVKRTGVTAPEGSRLRGRPRSPRYKPDVEIASWLRRDERSPNRHASRAFVPHSPSGTTDHRLIPRGGGAVTEEGRNGLRNPLRRQPTKRRRHESLAEVSRSPAARLALVRAAEERQRRSQEDLQVEERAPVLHVPDVQLDSLLPGKRGPAVDLRPAGDARLHVEAAPLAIRVLLDLVAQGWARPDQAHVAADDVPELRQLVEREPPQDASGPRDARIALVHGPPGSLLLGAGHHRAELEQLEVLAVPPDAPLPVEDGAAVLELDRERRGGEERARKHEAERGSRHVQRAVHRVPSAFSQTAGTPCRR